MRSKFEALPEIAERLHTVAFNEQFNDYHAAMINSSLSVNYVRGAWYAYQEQQNKIDSIKEKLTAIYDACDENTTVAILLDEIKECLK